MDENEYKQTYRDFNERKCVFEKAINARRCTCSLSQKFNLADREGVNCRDEAANITCSEFLKIMRSKASFALHMTKVPGPLPHAKEIKVQVGGMLGVQALIFPQQEKAENVQDIIALLKAAMEKYGSLDSLPYAEIMQSVVSFEGRSRRQPKR